MAVPIWSEATVIADRVLQKGSVARQTLDLRTRFGAHVLVSLGRSGSTAFTNGVDVLIRRTLGDDAQVFPTPVAAFRTAVGASIAVQTLNSAYAAAVTVVNFNAQGNFAADDLICFWGTTTNPNTFTDSTDVTGKLEFARIAKIVTGPPAVVTVDAATKLARLSGEYVTDQAEFFSAWVEGGAKYEVIVDYGDDAVGDPVAVRVKAHVLESAV